MDLSKIIEKLDLQVVSPYSNAEKVSFLNSVIEDIKRFAGETEIYSFNSAGLKMYPLPDGICGECIKGVCVGGREISPAYDGEAGDEFYFLLPTGFIGFSVRPKVGQSIKITYSALSEIEYDADSQEETDVRIDPEYVTLLVTGAAAEIAAGTEDITLSNNLRASYNRLYSQALQNHYSKRGAYPRTKRAGGKR